MLEKHCCIRETIACTGINSIRALSLDLRSKMETVKLTMEREHERVAHELNMEVDKKLKMEDHQVYGWSFRLSRNVSKQEKK